MRSTVSDERKRSFSLRPSIRFFSSTWAKAPPLPGLTCAVFTATHRPPSCWITLPGLIALPLIFMRGQSLERAEAELGAEPSDAGLLRQGEGCQGRSASPALISSLNVRTAAGGPSAYPQTPAETARKSAPA